jgi:hypothetical protein
MRFSHEIGCTDIQKQIEEAIEAWTFGYDMIWVTDHLADLQAAYANYDAWTTMAFIGAKTTKLMLASGVKNCGFLANLPFPECKLLSKADGCIDRGAYMLL